MNSTKKINVNFSSLVGLKAELLRKQTEVKEAKVKAETVYTVPKPNKKPRKLKEETSKNKLNELVDVDDINAHKKSRLMLEAKARLYERLKKSKKGHENYLVDFTNKSDESEEDEYFNDADYDDENSDPEESWIEYEDCFGRTRKCLRKDLPLMRKKDDLVKQQVMKDGDKTTDTNDNVSQTITFPEKEPEIEVMRRKWEEQTEKLADKVNIHYQDVLFDEARAHGVGYYAFSQDEEERAKQQENLAKLRKQTEQKQKEMKELKDLRDKMEQNRLKAARIRQRIRAGLPAEPTEHETVEDTNIAKDENINTPNDKNETSNDIIDEPIKKPSGDNCEGKSIDVEEETNKEDTAAAKEDKIRALGELLGKRIHWREMSQEEWVNKRRKDRKKEFAPVYENFNSVGYLNNSKDLSPTAKKNYIDYSKESDDTVSEKEACNSANDISTNDSDTIGPIPPTPLPSTILSVPPVPTAPSHVFTVPTTIPVTASMPSEPVPMPNAPLIPVISAMPPMSTVSTMPPVPPMPLTPPIPPGPPVPPVSSPLVPSSESSVASVDDDSNVYRTNFGVNTEYNHHGYSWNMPVDPQTSYYATLNPMAMYQHPYYSYVHNASYTQDASIHVPSAQSALYPNTANAATTVSTSHTVTASNTEPIPPVTKTIDEERIAAGLKYLREKFEKRQNG